MAPFTIFNTSYMHVNQLFCFERTMSVYYTFDVCCTYIESLSNQMIIKIREKKVIQKNGVIKKFVTNA